MQESHPDRLACAILIGEQALNKAVDLLVEAGFATEHIRILWRHALDDDDPADTSAAESPPDGNADPVRTVGQADQEDDNDDAPSDDLSEAAVVLRTGVRRMLPIGAALGVLGADALVWFDGNPAQALIPQLVTAAATGAFLGGMAGLVLGLGHWQHFIDLPAHYTDASPTLVAVDVVAQGREPEALSAFQGAGASDITICSSLEAEQLVRALSLKALGRS